MNSPASAKPPLFLRHLWYFALHSAALKAGRMERRILLGEPVLLGRTHDGRAFALRDICPHRGVPLSAGKIEGEDVECSYHGWRFRSQSGQCTLIPSLVTGQEMNIARIRVRNFPLHEANGLIWIFMADDAARDVEPSPPPDLSLPASVRPRLIEAQEFPAQVDHAVVGLMDPAHGPFVHTSWWWRGKTKPYEKAKNFAPSPLGFTMTSHKPSTNSLLYRILGGDLKTEISFQLPGIRVERITAGKRWLIGLTTVTPLESERTDVTQTFFWSVPWLSPFKPFLRRVARAFLSQDRDMVVLQREGLRFDPPLMLIRDADVPAMWYYRLKKEWADASEQRRPFVNPVSETTLRWKS